MFKSRRAKFLVCIVFIVAFAAGLALTRPRLSSVGTASTTPSAEFIAAAMRRQEKPGMALHVRYSWTDRGVVRKQPRAEVEVVTDRYYVRTPETIFLEDKVTNHFSPGSDTSNLTTASSVVTSSFDRTTGEYRRMTKFDGMPAEGEVTRDFRDIAQMTRVESVAEYIANASLCSLVQPGTVLEKMELIDGHKCWGVAYDMIPDVQRHVVWVDPDIGFCPRRIETILQKQLRIRKTMRGYRDIGHGVWFPKEVVLEVFSKTGAPVNKTTTTVKDAKVLPIDSKDKLQVEFPPKASVTYDPGLKRYFPWLYGHR